MADHNETQQFLAPPILAAIRANEVTARIQIERSISQDMREERADLKEAAEQSLNVVLDLSLDGTVRWASPSWKDVVGTTVDSIQGQPITTVLLDGSNSTVFTDAIESLQKDDSRSYIVRFKVGLGPHSVLKRNSNVTTTQSGVEGDHPDEEPEVGEAGEVEQVLNLEGQGIMVYDRSSKGENHVSPIPSFATF